ncbi:hypothetical protein HMPREF1430_00240 [Helicobacter pylori GAM96Ai]|uniref:CagC family type IV secretion system protein n=1 Tax=Helicobacter pylori TaxID=210 RepID=UPI0002BB2315|nr:CagC family type IV secretion system protein [Helicobacter pylori]EMH44825.1 hypothetical protein HMPREF1430_00240 [Helicobacter pylori GAM96Ai]
MERLIKKVFKKPSKLYQRIILGLSVAFATNSCLMAAVDPMTGITSIQSVAKKAIAVIVLIIGGILVVKGVADIWKITNDVKTGNKDIWAYGIPIGMLAVAALLVFLSSTFGFSVSES